MGGKEGKMNLDNVKRILAEEGIHARELTVYKNGVPFTGISVSREEDCLVQPVAYVEDGMTEEELLERARELAEMPEVPTQKLMHFMTSREYFMENVNLALVKTAPEGAVALPYLGQMLCLKLHVKDFPYMEGQGSVIITQQILDSLGIDKDEAVRMASRNTGQRLVTKPVASVLGMEPGAPFFDNGLILFSTVDDTDGASALAFKGLFRECCMEHHFDSMLLLPSSTEEVLGMQMSDSINPMECLMMVREINDSCVNPLIQLNPAVYQYDLASDTISVIAGGGSAYESEVSCHE